VTTGNVKEEVLLGKLVGGVGELGEGAGETDPEAEAGRW